MQKFLKRLGRKNLMIVLFLAALVIAALISFALFRSYAGSGTGVSYDWRKGTVLNNYTQVSTMPADWDFVTFMSQLQDGTMTQFGFWVPIGSPMIASRDIKLFDKGDDVLALQNTLNALNSEDKTDPYYFKPLKATGIYDQETKGAVLKMQLYFDLNPTGVADIDFQSTLYEQIGTPAE